MSKEETGNKEASGSSAGFDSGFKGIKDKMESCCGTEGKWPDCRTMFEGFKNACFGNSAEEDSAGPDEPKKGCC